MVYPETTELINWIVGLFATSFIAIVIGIINIIKSGRMVKRDIASADLTNKSKEVSLADQYEALAEKAATKVLKMQERIDNMETTSLTLEGSISSLQSEYTSLRKQVEDQDGIIQSQTKIIEEQSKRLDEQGIQIKEQQEEIINLRLELSKQRVYNASLIEQMREAKIMPIDPPVGNDEEELEKIKKEVSQKKKKAVKNGN